MGERKTIDESNPLRGLLVGGPLAPAYAPEGLLIKHGYNVERFAYACGLSRQSIYLYLHGRNKPSMTAIEQMCHVLEIPVEEMLKYTTPYFAETTPKPTIKTRGKVAKKTSGLKSKR